MYDFLSDFFKSDMIKDNTVAVITILALFLSIGALLMWLYMHFVHQKYIEVRSRELREKNRKLEKERESLISSVEQLQREKERLLEESKKFKVSEEIKACKNFNPIDQAFEDFIKNK